MAVKTIPMIRSPVLANGGPVRADVHPDEIRGMEAAGWMVEPQPEQPKRRGRPPKKETD